MNVEVYVKVDVEVALGGTVIWPGMDVKVWVKVVLGWDGDLTWKWRVSELGFAWVGTVI